MFENFCHYFFRDTETGRHRTNTKQYRTQATADEQRRTKTKPRFPNLPVKYIHVQPQPPTPTTPNLAQGRPRTNTRGRQIPRRVANNALRRHPSRPDSHGHNRNRPPYPLARPPPPRTHRQQMTVAQLAALALSVAILYYLTASHDIQ